MTDGQKYLFKLFREVNDICKKHNIKYYLAGGTLIGAIRHKGFVPWDDDFDIYMTRDEFLKFVEVAKKGGLPDNRLLECQELNHSYRNIFARYTDTSNSAIHKNQLISDDVAGEVLDILQLDPLPAGKRILTKHIQKLMLYSDMINPSVSYSGRTESNRFRYFFYKKLEKIIGHEKVLSLLEKKMFFYREEDCPRYVMRWGGAPLIFDKDMFEPAEYAEFEGILCPIPRLSNDYLRDHYSDDWMFVPQMNEQIGHEAVHNLSLSYRFIRQDYFPYIDREEILNNYLIRKKNTIVYGKNGHRIADVLVELRGIRLRKELEYFAEQKHLNFEELLKKEKYEVITEFFKPYYTMQYSAQFIGRDNFKHYYRFSHPLVIELKVDMLYAALLSEVILGNVAKPYRVLEIYEAVHKQLPIRVLELKNYILAQREAIHLYSIKQYKKSYEVMEPLLEQYPKNISLIKLKILLMFRLGHSIVVREKYISKVRKFYPEDGELIKYAGDVLFEKKEYCMAGQLYLAAREKTTNGYAILDLNAHVEQYITKLLSKLRQAGKQKNFTELESVYEEIMNYSFLPLAYQADLIRIDALLDTEVSLDKLISFLERLSIIEDSLESMKEEIFKLRYKILIFAGSLPLVADMQLKIYYLDNDDFNGIILYKKELEKQMNDAKAQGYNYIYYDCVKLMGDLCKLEGKQELAFSYYRSAAQHMDYVSPVIRYELLKIFEEDLSSIDNAFQERHISVDVLFENMQLKYSSVLELLKLLENVGLNANYQIIDEWYQIFQKGNNNECITKENLAVAN